MNFLKTMDLYQGIILFSLVLLPAGGWWVNSLTEEIALCETALRNATKRGGLLEEIGELQKKIEVVAQNQRSTSQAVDEPSQYFQEQIMAVSNEVRANNFTPGVAKSSKIKRGKQTFQDFEIDIKWAKSTPPAMMDFIYAVIFNCESGARRGLTRGSPSVWRLRKLHIQNASAKAWYTGKKTPTPEMEDRWTIRSMKFARREPFAGK